MDHPFESRANIVSRDIPISRAHWVSVIDRVWNVIILLVEVLLACSILVAHRQLSLVYIPALSMRSREYAREGLSPTSEMKTEKLFHLGSTVIPFAPYLGYDAWFGFVHRFHILAQIWYSAPLAFPCFVFDAISFLRVSQVQRFVFSFLRFSSKATTIIPHKHWHSHWYRLLCSSDRPRTVKEPYCCPMLSTDAVFITLAYQSTSYVY